MYLYVCRSSLYVIAFLFTVFFLLVRFFAFLGTCGFCVLGLMVNPPKSSYWIRR